MTILYCPACGHVLQYVAAQVDKHRRQPIIVCFECPIASSITRADGIHYAEDIGGLRLTSFTEPQFFMTPLTRTAQPFADIRRES
jgi:hypothetical protein